MCDIISMWFFVCILEYTYCSFQRLKVFFSEHSETLFDIPGGIFDGFQKSRSGQTPPARSARWGECGWEDKLLRREAPGGGFTGRGSNHKRSYALVREIYFLAPILVRFQNM